jgi:hypothetical protein
VPANRIAGKNRKPDKALQGDAVNRVRERRRYANGRHLNREARPVPCIAQLGCDSGLQVALPDGNPCTPIRCFFTKLLVCEFMCGSQPALTCCAELSGMKARTSRTIPSSIGTQTEISMSIPFLADLPRVLRIGPNLAIVAVTIPDDELRGEGVGVQLDLGPSAPRPRRTRRPGR